MVSSKADRVEKNRPPNMKPHIAVDAMDKSQSQVQYIWVKSARLMITRSVHDGDRSGAAPLTLFTSHISLPWCLCRILCHQANAAHKYCLHVTNSPSSSFRVDSKLYPHTRYCTLRTSPPTLHVVPYFVSVCAYARSKSPPFVTVFLLNASAHAERLRACHVWELPGCSSFQGIYDVFSA